MLSSSTKKSHQCQSSVTIPRYNTLATVAQDLEPEYIAVGADSHRAWVTLQENNAIAVLDIATATITDIFPLGYKDYAVPPNALDASDRDNAINIANWPVRGMYQPDAIASFESGGETFLITANEGDARGYKCFSEEVHVGDLTLNPAVFANAEELQEPENLGRLKTTTATGDADGDGQHETIFNCSDDKGPEPEGLTIGQIGGRTYAFIGFERGGIAV